MQTVLFGVLPVVVFLGLCLRAALRHRHPGGHDQAAPEPVAVTGGEPEPAGRFVAEHRTEQG